MNWVPGGVLRVYSRRHAVWHFGIASLIPGMVYHASKDRGRFVLTTFDEFSEGQNTLYAWFPESWEKREQVLSGAERQLGKPFNLMAANCEDYVNFIVTGVARSPQRDAFVVVAALGAVIGIIAAARTR